MKFSLQTTQYHRYLRKTSITILVIKQILVGKKFKEKACRATCTTGDIDHDIANRCQPVALERQHGYW